MKKDLSDSQVTDIQGVKVRSVGISISHLESWNMLAYIRGMRVERIVSEYDDDSLALLVPACSEAEN